MEKARMLGTDGAVAGGTEGGRSPTGVPPATAAATGLGGPGAGNGEPIPDPGVPEKPVRRRFTAEYKLRTLREADRSTESGQLGAMLRREGLYSSHLTAWRKQRSEGTLASLEPKRRGRKTSPDAPLVAENERLQRDNQRLTARLRQAETIIEVQKKLSEILGIPLPPPDSNGSMPGRPSRNLFRREVQPRRAAVWACLEQRSTGGVSPSRLQVPPRHGP